MGRKPWEHKRDAKIAARLRVAGDASDTNKRKEVTEAFSDARRDRRSKDGGSGGFIPSAKHVEGGMERYAMNACGHRNNRPSLCIEGTERYDNAGPTPHRPGDRYRAPSLRTKVDPVRPAIQPDVSRVGTGPSIIGNDTRANRSAFAEGVERDRRSILTTGFIRRPADPDGRAIWEAGKQLATESD